MQEKELRKRLREMYRSQYDHPRRPNSKDFRGLLEDFDGVPEALRTIFPTFRFLQEGEMGAKVFAFIASKHKSHRGKVVKILTTGLLSPKPYVRDNSFQALREITKRCSDVAFPIPALVKAISGKKPNAALYGMENLYEVLEYGTADISPAIPIVETLLEHKDKRLSGFAGELLGAYWTLKHRYVRLFGLLGHASHLIALNAFAGMFRFFPIKSREKKKFDFAGLIAIASDILSNEDWELQCSAASALERSSRDADISKAIPRIVAFIESADSEPGALPVEQRDWPDKARFDAAHALLNAAKRGSDVAPQLPDGSYKTANLVLKYADEKYLVKGKPEYKRLVRRCKIIWNKWLG